MFTMERLGFVLSACLFVGLNIITLLCFVSMVRRLLGGVTITRTIMTMNGLVNKETSLFWAGMAVKRRGGLKSKGEGEGERGLGPASTTTDLLCNEDERTVRTVIVCYFMSYRSGGSFGLSSSLYWGSVY